MDWIGHSSSVQQPQGIVCRVSKTGWQEWRHNGKYFINGGNSAHPLAMLKIYNDNQSINLYRLQYDNWI